MISRFVALFIALFSIVSTAHALLPCSEYETKASRAEATQFCEDKLKACQATAPSADQCLSNRQTQCVATCTQGKFGDCEARCSATSSKNQAAWKLTCLHLTDRFKVACADVKNECIAVASEMPQTVEKIACHDLEEEE